MKIRVSQVFKSNFDLGRSQTVPAVRLTRLPLAFVVLCTLVAVTGCSSRNLHPGEPRDPCQIITDADVADLLSAKVDPGIADTSRRNQHVCTFLFADRNDTGAISLALYLPGDISPKNRWETMKENFKRLTKNAFRVENIGDDAAWVELAPQYYTMFALSDGYIFTLNVSYPQAGSVTDEFRIAYKLAQLVIYRLENPPEQES